MVTTIAELELHPLAKELLRLLRVDRAPDRARLFAALERHLSHFTREAYREAAEDVLWVGRYLDECGDEQGCLAIAAAVRAATRRIAARDGLLPLLDGVVPPDTGPAQAQDRGLPHPPAPTPRAPAPLLVEAFEAELDLDRLHRLAEQSAWLQGPK